MDLKEVRTLAALMFASFQGSGHGIDAAIEQSLEAAEKMLLRSNAREKARREAAVRQAELEAAAAAQLRELQAFEGQA